MIAVLGLFARLVALTGWAWALGRGTGSSIALGLAAVIPLAGCWAYGAAVFHVLSGGVLAFWILGGVCFLGLGAWRLRRKGLPSWKEAGAWLPPSSALGLLLLAGYALVYGDLTLHQWDEFASWGVRVKEFLLADGLPLQPRAIPSYPPGPTLLEILFLSPSGGTEGQLYQGGVALLLLHLQALGGRIPWRRGVWGGAVLLAGICGVSFLGSGFFSLFVDHLLAVLWGGTLALYFLYPKTAGTWSLLIPSLTFLPLVKMSGLLLALVVVGLMLVDQGLRRRQRGGASAGIVSRRVKAPQGEEESRRGDSPRTRRLVLVLLVLMPLLGALSWKAHLAFQGVEEGWKPRPGASLAEVWLGGGEDTQKQVHQRFLRALAFGRVSNMQKDVSEQWVNGTSRIPLRGFSWVVWMGVLSGFAGVAVFSAPRHDRRRVGILSLAVLLFLIVYALGLESLYLRRFSPFEALRLASFPRYMQTSLLGGLLVLGTLSLAGTEGQSPSRGLSWFGCVLWVGLLFLEVPTWGDLIYPLRYPTAPLEGRESLLPRVQAVRSVVGADKSLFLVAQNEAGFWRNLVGYELFPRRWGGGAVGTPWGPDDVWTRNLTPEEWSEELRGYDYVFVVIPNRELWERYGRLWAPGTNPSSDFLFLVRKKSEGVLLEPLRFRAAP